MLPEPQHLRKVLRKNNKRIKREWSARMSHMTNGGGVETQRSRPRSRTQKTFETKAKDRPSRGQSQGHRHKCSSKKRASKVFFRQKRSSKKFFSRYLHVRETKKDVRKFSARFLAFSNKISTVQKIVLSSSRGQGNFRGLEALRPRTSKCVIEDVLEAKDVLKDSTSDD